MLLGYWVNTTNGTPTILSLRTFNPPGFENSDLSARLGLGVARDETLDLLLAESDTVCLLS